MNRKKIPAIDLFSGAGGLSQGLSMVGFKISGAVEINKSAIKTYTKQPFSKKTAIMNSDISTLSGESILKKSKIKRDEVYLLAGCPPCQNFSPQNRNKHLLPIEVRVKLLYEYLRIIKEINPPFVLMENVPGLSRGDLKHKFDDFVSQLKENYHVEYDILNAADYGVPQKRKRLVLHAIRNDINAILKSENVIMGLPPKTHNSDGSNGLKKWITVMQAIGDLPLISAGENFKSNEIYNHRCARLSDKNLERITIIRQNGGSRSGLPSQLQLKCHNEYLGHKDVYGIMNPNEPAPTLTGGCLSYSKGRYGHPFQNRAISAREAARIQTFPDSFIFEGALNDIALQVGNAVPIELVKASGMIIKDLAYKYLEIKQK